jgi:hypothetical protein
MPPEADVGAATLAMVLGKGSRRGAGGEDVRLFTCAYPDSVKERKRGRARGHGHSTLGLFNTTRNSPDP